MRFHYTGSERLPQAVTVQAPQGATTYLLGYDQVGSLKAAAAMDGEGEGRVVKAMDYDAFGNVLTDSNPALFMPIAFAGGLRDRFTGLVRFCHRDYGPTEGRFTAPTCSAIRAAPTTSTTTAWTSRWGGWSWYTGAAAHMLYAAYALLGIKVEHGRLTLAPDFFAKDRPVQVEKVFYRGEEFSVPGGIGRAGSTLPPKTAASTGSRPAPSWATAPIAISTIW